MEGLAVAQRDICERINKAKSNFKKSPRERLSKDYVEVKLESLEKLWGQFIENHSQLLRTYGAKVLESDYMKKDMYSETEDNYVECKLIMKTALAKYVEEPEQFSECNLNSSKGNTKGSNAKLPKIIIPKFSGKYSEWRAFRDLYVSLVHNTEMEPIQKMQYLKGLLSGEAEQLVRHISLAADNYMRCWDMLESRYNNKRYLCNIILKRLLEQPNAKAESAKFIRELLDTTSECLGALSSLGVNVSGWDIIIVYIASLRLDHESRKQWELQSANTTELPTWKSFEEFLTNRFRALEFVDSNPIKAKPYQPTQRSFHVTEKSDKTITCKFCKESHRLPQCKKFQSEGIQARRQFVEKYDLCFNCLGDNHRAIQCRSLSTCRVCQRRHHTYLHIRSADSGTEQKKEISDPGKGDSKPAETATPVVCFSSGGMAPNSQVLLATALVRANTSSGDTRIIRALLDQGSQASFVTEATAQYLGLKRTPVRGVISGVGGSTSVSSNSMVNLTIKSIYDQNVSLNLNVYVLKSITTLLPSKEVVATEWILGDIPLADPKYNIPNKIDILLGAAVYGQVVQDGVKKNSEGTLLAQNTTLGWILSGIGSNQDKEEANIISMHTCVQDIQLKRFWELEADTVANKKTILTNEEANCEKFFAETTARDQDGRYIVRLPFKTSNPVLKLEDTKRIAERRLNLLVAKLRKSNEMKAKNYTDVMEEYLQLGHMEKIPEDEVKKSYGAYLSHFAVIRNDKDTTKVRIVFDASCKGESGVSLNDLLMVGPRLQPELRHLLLNWRSHRICLSADIIKMYRQVKVAAEDVDFQRILWKKDQLETKTEELRLLRVTFGTASAPYLAVKALQQVAHDEGANYPTAAEKVISDFYMDDLLTGCEDVETAVKIYSEMNELLLKGGFQLQKWSSNCEEVLEIIKKAGEGIDEEEGLKLKEDEIMKLLGLTWNRKNDAFQYTVTLPPLEEPVTKRKIIADIARLFDPMGWVAPCVIIAKAIIQKLWISGTDWDEIAPNKILEEWFSYRDDLVNLSSVKIPRWIQTSQKNLNVELHGFSDASKIAYAAAVYVRVVDENGDIHVNLVTAKTKVAPIKQISIPRLELCGAVLVTRLLLEVSEVLKINKEQIHAWTDSTVVLAWLNSHPSRWQTFVANRVSEILTSLEAHQWSHIRSQQNPADGASRGLKPKELIENNLWFKGPEILHAKEVMYNRLKNEETNIEEIKAHIATKQEGFWDRFSNFSRMIRVIAYCRRFLSWKQRKGSRDLGILTTSELKEATETCIRECQREHFGAEIAILENIKERSIKLKNPLKSLNPYIDAKNILRVGGRLENTSFTEDRKHPILIPKKSVLTDLIVADAHAKTLHGGIQLMLTYLRSKFWILGAKDLVKRYARKCVKCVRYSAATAKQMMGQLPVARVTPTRPFRCSGVDYAGPINVRTSKGRGHHAYKGYICLFVCMATKAVHLEVVSDLTSQGFLAAFRRFVSRRGHCSEIWSDNGTNFVGASRELANLFSAEKATMSTEIAQILANEGTQWHFIPPLAPNFGGLWEAGVKSVKFHLKRVIGDTTLTYEELSTVLGQIEACLNSRPLFRADTESEGFEALTPGHFLVGEPLLTVPDYNFESSNIGSLRRWQLTQRMMQTFWRRWSQEYLSSLVHRYKWADQKPEPNIGDLVLIKEDHLPPARWLLGRVVVKHPGADNLTRVVSLRTKNSNVIKRPITKLCFLPVN